MLERITDIIDDNVDRLQKDLAKLSPAERVKALTSLIGYVIPKKQSLNVQESLDYEYQRLKDLLESAPDDAIDEIVERMNAMRESDGR